MTPFRNDAGNPFLRARPWPPLPQTPLGLGGHDLARWKVEPVAGSAAEEADSGLLFFDSQPEAEHPPAVTPRRSRKPRLMPLVGATAVGVCGLATLFLAIGRP